MDELDTYKKQKLTIEVIYNSATAVEPAFWDWDELLDLTSDEEFIILDHSEPVEVLID